MNNQPISIEITTVPTKLQYIVDEPLDLAGISVTGTFAGDLTAAVNIDESNASGFDSSKASTSQTVTVTVEGCSDTFNIAVITPEESWHQVKNEAEMELVNMEASLKASYNAYVDCIVAYLGRLNTANDVRRILYNSRNEKIKKDNFTCSAEPFIENQAVKYLLDTINPSEIKSPTIVSACDATKLLDKKAE
jgi:hypothetical protein